MIKGIVEVFHAIADTISGCTRIPIVGTERIVVAENKIQDFLSQRRKIAVRRHHPLQTLLGVCLFPVKITFATV